MALSKQALVAKAEDLYIYSDFNQQEICDILGITDKTLRGWIKKYGWEETKKSNSITTPKIISVLIKSIYDHTNGDASDVIDNADKIVKLSSAVEKLKGKELYLHNYIEVFKDIISWLFTKGDQKRMVPGNDGEITLNGNEAAKVLNLWMKDFLQEKIHG